MEEIKRMVYLVECSLKDRAIRLSMHSLADDIMAEGTTTDATRPKASKALMAVSMIPESSTP